ncbi:MAG TPA: hypothetical protein VHT49_14740 [Acidimicrobiales bacterium]|nr:hypothetical protein [Acidimicrobiales bacterium]
MYEANDRQVGTPAAVAMELDHDRGSHLGRRLLGRRVARTTHPHVVSTYDRGKHGGRAFVAFRPPPRNLATELEVAPFPAHRVTQMGIDLGSALEVLHRAGAKLGSLHPGHVGIDADGAVRLSPWPLATAPGGWGGQGAWSPPEIVAGGTPSVAGDIWSLGAVLLSSLVGTGPGQLSPEATEELADRLRHDANPALVDAIGRSMVSQRSRRFASAGGLAAALEGEPVAHRPAVIAGVPRLLARTRGLAVGSAGVVAVLSATTVGVALSSIGATNAIGHVGVHHHTAPSPPATVRRPASTPPTSAAVPNGAVALAAAPPSTTSPSASAGRVSRATGAAVGGVPAVSLSQGPTVTPTTSTTSVPTTSTPAPSLPAPIVSAQPVVATGSGDQAPSPTSGSGNPNPGHGSGGHGPGSPNTTTTTTMTDPNSPDGTTGSTNPGGGSDT